MLKLGQILTFAEGEYSDYMVEGLVKVIKPFDLKQVQNEWEELHTKEDSHSCYVNRTLRRVKEGGVAFLPYLVHKGLVEDVDYIEIHTGSYGKAEITYDETYI